MSSGAKHRRKSPLSEGEVSCPPKPAHSARRGLQSRTGLISVNAFSYGEKRVLLVEGFLHPGPLPRHLVFCIHALVKFAIRCVFELTVVVVNGVKEFAGLERLFNFEQLWALDGVFSEFDVLLLNLLFKSILHSLADACLRQ